MNIRGQTVVMYRTILRLTCHALFATDELKDDPRIVLEWYHRGFRVIPDPQASISIHQRWMDSNVLESTLEIAWAGINDSGDWICIERNAPDILNSIKTPLAQDVPQSNGAELKPRFELIDFARISINIIGRWILRLLGLKPPEMYILCKPLVTSVGRKQAVFNSSYPLCRYRRRASDQLSETHTWVDASLP
ncbi:hypothetical protein Ciccas_000929 [Cichlidogyrus casuarinus]|uniref:Ig-like domain-containing protein n=1 Tax=Cichlidogyrus casuarinus TaxID=1844966 RepID=A0ABD2QLJ5_9PLAT